MNPTRSNARDDQDGSAEAPETSRAIAVPSTPNGLEQRVLAKARDVGFTANDRLIVGFSGGRDSLALAATLRWAVRMLGIDVVLVHVDHQLRPSSQVEARQAGMLAESLGMRFRAAAVSTSPIAGRRGVGLEEVARRERYQILFNIATEEGASAIATAHHLDDQAETVLLHLLRGGGVHGAAAMAERSPVPYVSFPSKSNISLKNPSELARHTPWLWRPLLTEKRDTITEYVQGVGLQPIEDPSNDDTTLRRNFIRHEILPLLEQRFSRVSEALARYAALAADDDRTLEDLAMSVMEEVVNPGGVLTASQLTGRPLAIQRRVIRRWIIHVTGLSGLTAERTDAILALAQTPRGGKAIEAGEGWTVRRQRGMLRAYRTES